MSELPTEKFDIQEAVNVEILNSPDITPDEYAKMKSVNELEEEALEDESQAVNEAVYLSVTEEEKDKARQFKEAVSSAGVDVSGVKGEVMEELICHVWELAKSANLSKPFYLLVTGGIFTVVFRSEIAHVSKAVYGFFSKLFFKKRVV